MGPGVVGGAKIALAHRNVLAHIYTIYLWKVIQLIPILNEEAKHGIHVASKK